MVKKTKILWVCNIMLPVIAEALGVESSNKEGWLSGLCDIILERQQENGIELHVAYPVGREQDGSSHEIQAEKGMLYAHGFYEDVANAERYEEGLEERIQRILEQVNPDVVHCFGTEYGHTLAAARCIDHPEHLLIGIQGVCRAIAQAYMADLPEQVQNSITFRDWLKKDSIRMQQQKFVLRAKREAQVLSLAGNVTGRTEFDRHFTEQSNPNAVYYSMNETLRAPFYKGQWNYDTCEPHTIFLSQGDYPLKGLHYMLLAAGKLVKLYPDLKICIAGNSLVNYRTLKDKIKISAYGKYLRRLICENHLEDRVHFLGRLTAQEMKQQYLKSGLYVCCSSNENSPNSLGEAMLLGVPCVAANVGGIPSLFEDGRDGILYEGYNGVETEEQAKTTEADKLAESAGNEWNHGDNKNNVRYSKNDTANTATNTLKKNGEKIIESKETSELDRNVENLAQAIEKMWSNREEMERYSENARLHAKRTHDKELNYQKMTEIYAEIAGR